MKITAPTRSIGHTYLISMVLSPFFSGREYRQFINEIIRGLFFRLCKSAIPGHREQGKIQGMVIVRNIMTYGADIAIFTESLSG